MVTDVESFITDEAMDTDLEKNDIRMGKAKEIAGANANLIENDVCFVSTKVGLLEGKIYSYRTGGESGFSPYECEK